MMKKAISLMLCILMILTVFAGCAKERDENDKGAYVYMYLTDPVYNFDPAYAYTNESSLKIASLLFDTLFILDDNGKVQKSLAKDYKILEDEKADEYKMIITLNDTSWSDGIAVSANDIVYSWKRILDVSGSYDSAALLYDIKYAKEAKAGEMSIDDVRIYALNETQLEIQFEGKIDYDQFLVNLTSFALAPLREEVVKRAEEPDDWAKKPSVMITCGPFRIRSVNYEPGEESITLERNSYYYRDFTKDDIDEAVTPYRLVVDYMTDEEIKTKFENGEIFYVGDIPLSLRGEWKDKAEVSDALSTHTYYLNENAVVRYYNASEFEKLSSNESVFDGSLVEGTDGDKIFAKADVRKALSLVIDREAIANEIVFAKAANALVPYGIFDTSRKTSFREEGGALISTSANLAEAQALLSKAGVKASDYMFAISVASYDEVHVKIAEMVQTAWAQLGFHVALNKIDVVSNKDILLTTQEPIEGIKDDIFIQNFNKTNYEVAAIDSVAISADAVSVLAPFAKGYTGRAAASLEDIFSDFTIPTHATGYDSESYNAKIEQIFGTTNIDERASLLHEAEKILMEDMPVIPIIFNQNATLTSDKLSKLEYTYYGSPIFTKMKLKDYLQYVPVES